MEQTLTQEDLTSLGVAVYEDGIDAHCEEVTHLAQLLSAAAPDDQLVAVVADAGAPEIVRLRALAHVAEDWPAYSQPFESHANQDFDSAFEDLLARWRMHQDLRASGAASKELFASRTALDKLRQTVTSLRRQLL